MNIRATLAALRQPPFVRPLILASRTRFQSAACFTGVEARGSAPPGRRTTALVKGFIQAGAAIGFGLVSVAFGPTRVALAQPGPETPETCADRPITVTPALIELGRRLFTEVTFNGNGRTCETCHRETNNFAIDPEFIATLPPNDPLFVAEFNSNLRDLENPAMMRQFGLILENLDGFAKPGVLRGVPHTLGLSQTTAIGVNDSVTGAPVHETGWSGDGTPGDGSLRCFPVGAIIQHFTKDLRRRRGIDFRLPLPLELDAMLAFQLSLGRTTTPAVSTFTFKDAAAEDGKSLFFGAIPTRNGGTRNCSGCHVEAGANNGAAFTARNRITSANLAPNAPVCTAPAAPGDGGFGKGGEFVDTVACEIGNVDVLFRSDEVSAGLRGFFNVPSLHEAADTPPFFHNNTAATLEGAISFYASDAFNESFGNVNRAFVFQATDIDDIGAFLRVINALENDRSAADYAARARPLILLARARPLLTLSIEELRDAITVLTDKGLHADAVSRLQTAAQLLRTARATIAAGPRRALIDSATAEITAARGLMVDEPAA